MNESNRRASPIPDETRPPQPKSGLSFVAEQSFKNNTVIGRSSVPLNLNKSFLSNSFEILKDKRSKDVS